MRHCRNGHAVGFGCVVAHDRCVFDRSSCAKMGRLADLARWLLQMTCFVGVSPHFS